MFKYLIEYIDNHMKLFQQHNIEVKKMDFANTQSTYVDFIIPFKKYGRITMWDNGMADYEATDYDGNQLFWYHEDNQTKEQIIGSIHVFMDMFLK